MKPDGFGGQKGVVYDPRLSPENLRFVNCIYSDVDYKAVKYAGRTFECDAYGRLGLGDLIDPTTGKWQKPILQLFDQLNQDDNASPLFRAFVFLKLHALAQMRPLDWGLQWAPGVEPEVKALLKEPGAGGFKSGDWMVPAISTNHAGPLSRLLQRARALPFEKQAQVFRQLARATCSQDFTLAGYVDVTGHPVLRQINIPSAEYWGWDARSGSATLLFRRADGQNTDKIGLVEPVPYTPLKVFLGDRRKVFRDTLEAAGCRREDVVPMAPPFFSDL
jgi:hypothetical protein